MSSTTFYWYWVRSSRRYLTPVWSVPQDPVLKDWAVVTVGVTYLTRELLVLPLRSVGTVPRTLYNSVGRCGRPVVFPEFTLDDSLSRF